MSLEKGVDVHHVSIEVWKMTSTHHIYLLTILSCVGPVIRESQGANELSLVELSGGLVQHVK